MPGFSDPANTIPSHDSMIDYGDIQPAELLDQLLLDAAAQLDDDARRDLKSLTTRRMFDRGEPIASESATAMHYVVSGQLRFFYQRPDGDELLITILAPGELFASGHDLTSGRHSRAEAMVPSTIDTIEMPAASQLTHTHPALSNFFLLNLIKLTQLLSGRVEALLSGDAASKVAYVLVDLATRLGRRRDDGRVALADGITQSDVAHMSGIRRETANKALAEFSSHGWTEIVGHTIVVRDLDALRRLAHTSELP